MFNLKITKLEKNDQTGAVHAVWFDAWKDDEQKKFTHGLSLDYNSSANDFIAFESLTEQQVMEWVKKEVSDKDLEVQYNRLYPQTIVQTIPWN